MVGIVTERDDDLCAVIARAEEARDLDYKAPAAWDGNDKKACCELVKDILAMANTVGGFLVVGVGEENGQYQWRGLDERQLASWDTTQVNAFVQRYADPPINVGLRRPVCDGKQYVVLTVPRFQFLPHICQKDFPGVLSVPALYVRTANNESAPLRSVSDFNDIIEQAVRTRQDQMLEAMRAILREGSLSGEGPNSEERFHAQLARIETGLADPYPEKGYEAFYFDAMYPARFEEDRFEIAALRQAAREASVSFRGWPFVFYHEGHDNIFVTNEGLRYESSWQTYSPIRASSDRFDFWELTTAGLLVRKNLLWEEARYRAQGYRIVDVESLVFHLAEAIDALVRYYTALGVTNEEITWRFSFEGTEGRVLQSVNSSKLIRPGYIARVPSITYKRTHSLEDWRAGLREHIARASQSVFERFGWDHQGGPFAEWADRLFSRNV